MDRNTLPVVFNTNLLCKNKAFPVTNPRYKVVFHISFLYKNKQKNNLLFPNQLYLVVISYIRNKWFVVLSVPIYVVFHISFLYKNKTCFKPIPASLVVIHIDFLYKNKQTIIIQHHK